nr:MAG TPA: hypothetical protein [Caudoviricetes sp.]
MENYLNHIYHLATTVIEFGKDMGGCVWKGVGATVTRSALQVGFTELTTIRIRSHCWSATNLVTKNSSGETKHELVESDGLTKALLDGATIREDQLRGIQPAYTL